MDVSTARLIANAMNRAGFDAAAENFVAERSRFYSERESKRLERAWLG